MRAVCGEKRSVDGRQSVTLKIEHLLEAQWHFDTGRDPCVVIAVSNVVGASAIAPRHFVKQIGPPG